MGIDTCTNVYKKDWMGGGGVNSETLFESFVSHSFIYNVNNDVPFFFKVSLPLYPS